VLDGRRYADRHVRLIIWSGELIIWSAEAEANSGGSRPETIGGDLGQPAIHRFAGRSANDEYFL
jgi:hypothetical protein